jgi:hypothetical protein
MINMHILTIANDQFTTNCTASFAACHLLRDKLTSCSAPCGIITSTRRRGAMSLNSRSLDSSRCGCVWHSSYS